MIHEMSSREAGKYPHYQSSLLGFVPQSSYSSYSENNAWSFMKQLNLSQPQFYFPF